MKKSEAMDLYEGLNGISPKMIEEAGRYKCENVLIDYFVKEQIDPYYI